MAIRFEAYLLDDYGESLKKNTKSFLSKVAKVRLATPPHLFTLQQKIIEERFLFGKLNGQPRGINIEPPCFPNYGFCNGNELCHCFFLHYSRVIPCGIIATFLETLHHRVQANPGYRCFVALSRNQTELNISVKRL